MTSGLENDLERVQHMIQRERQHLTGLIARRDWLMDRCVRSGLSVREVAAVAGVDHAVVVRARKRVSA